MDPAQKGSDVPERLTSPRYPEARYSTSLANIPGTELLLLCGGNSRTVGVLGDCWVFDTAEPDVNVQWTKTTPLEVAMKKHVMRPSKTDHYVYRHGGSYGPDSQVHVFHHDPDSTDTWTTVSSGGFPNEPTSRYDHIVVPQSSGEGFYTVGGYSAGIVSIEIVYNYEFSNVATPAGSWKTPHVTPLYLAGGQERFRRYHAGWVARDPSDTYDRIFLYSGHNGFENPGDILYLDFAAGDPSTSWVVLIDYGTGVAEDFNAKSPGSRTSAAAAQLDVGTPAYFFSGGDRSGALWYYDLSEFNAGTDDGMYWAKIEDGDTILPDYENDQAVYDVANDRIGGRWRSAMAVTSEDVWIYGGHWTDYDYSPYAKTDLWSVSLPGPSTYMEIEMNHDDPTETVVVFSAINGNSGCTFSLAATDPCALKDTGTPFEANVHSVHVTADILVGCIGKGIALDSSGNQHVFTSTVAWSVSCTGCSYQQDEYPTFKLDKRTMPGEISGMTMADMLNGEQEGRIDQVVTAVAVPPNPTVAENHPVTVSVTRSPSASCFDVSLIGQYLSSSGEVLTRYPTDEFLQDSWADVVKCYNTESTPQPMNCEFVNPTPAVENPFSVKVTMPCVGVPDAHSESCDPNPHRILSNWNNYDQLVLVFSVAPGTCPSRRREIQSGGGTFETIIPIHIVPAETSKPRAAWAWGTTILALYAVILTFGVVAVCLQKLVRQLKRQYWRSSMTL